LIHDRVPSISSVSHQPSGTLASQDNNGGDGNFVFCPNNRSQQQPAAVAAARQWHKPNYKDETKAKEGQKNTRQK
jgi:hypothetical protein